MFFNYLNKSEIGTSFVCLIQSMAPVKGDLAVYLDYVILGQLIPAMNSLENIDEYERLPNEVKMVIPLYNADSGEFLGIEKGLAFIMVRGDRVEAFFSYGYDKSKSKKLYSTSNNRICSAAPVSRNIRSF